MSLAHPLHLAAALTIAVAAAVVLYAAAAARRRGAITYSNLEFLTGAVDANPWVGRVLIALFAAGTAALVLSFGGPTVTLPMPVKDGQVFLCVDTSGSMSASDVLPTRSQAARDAANAFVRATPKGTRIGVIAFAGGASVVQPLTADRSRVDAAIAALPAPNGGTAIGDALALAGSSMQPGRHRVVVLITDGVSNQGADPLPIARELGRAHVVVYTIGIGTANGGMIPGTGQVATIDEDALRSYAAVTGGSYARADSAETLRAALSRLGRVTGFERVPVDASFGLAAGAAAAMLIAAMLGFAWGRFP